MPFTRFQRKWNSLDFSTKRFSKFVSTSDVTIIELNRVIVGSRVMSETIDFHFRELVLRGIDVAWQWKLLLNVNLFSQILKKRSAIVRW